MKVSAPLLSLAMVPLLLLTACESTTVDTNTYYYYSSQRRMEEQRLARERVAHPQLEQTLPWRIGPARHDSTAITTARKSLTRTPKPTGPMTEIAPPPEHGGRVTPRSTPRSTPRPFQRVAADSETSRPERSRPHGNTSAYPTAKKAREAGYVISPYTKAKIPVKNIPSGAQVLDPSSEKVFINP